MAVGLGIQAPLLPVAGVRISSTQSGIRKQGRDDLTLIALEEGAVVTGVYTRNLFCAAPVERCKQFDGENVRALLINTGYANAGTGQAGVEVMEACCRLAAEAVGCEPSQVLPFSTGIIGEALPLQPIQKHLPSLASSLGDDWLRAASAIMTTDTRPKGISEKIQLSKGEVTLTGISKGAGMICPNMGTMLAFVATDAELSESQSRAWLREAADSSFNCITVDGDTSTNDACMLMSSGASKVKVETDADQEIFTAALKRVMTSLADQIIRDGEGVSRIMEIKVVGAPCQADAKTVAYAVAHSPLVKTALHAGDPNWGRILAAVGRSGVSLDMNTLSIQLGEVLVVTNGELDPDYCEEDAAQEVNRDCVRLTINLGLGDAVHRVVTSDFSAEYVRVNAEYRS